MKKRQAVSWIKLKAAAEDLQKMLGVEPPLTHNIKCNDKKLRAWIIEAIELIKPGYEFQDSTIQVLSDEFSFEMPEGGESYEDDEYDPNDYIPDPDEDDPESSESY